MIGRGALGNPWIFARAEKERLRFEEVSVVMTGHLEAMLAYHGQRGLILFRKHVKRYLRTLSTLKPYVRRMVTAKTTEEFLDVLSVATEQFGAHTLATLKD
jgi:tRNA-dihydrouridine synthase